MLVLHSGSGSGQFELLSRCSAVEEELLFSACQLLLSRGEKVAANFIATGNFELWDGTNDFNDDFYVLLTYYDISKYEGIKEKIDKHGFNSENRDIYRLIADTVSEVGRRAGESEIYIRFIVCDFERTQYESDWRAQVIASTQNINNQALFNFKDGQKFKKDELNFRSKTEIRLYEALVKRGLLILPLPVVILGEPNKRREPDFVIAYKGKMGILEIHGEAWHPAETSSKEADRRRLFRGLGVPVYEVFDASRCWNDPEGVINEFLKSFET